MATITSISTKGGGGGKKSLDYICRDDKTEGKKYVTALNCSLPTAYQEFKNTREMYGKTDGVKYYHFVQSHPSGYKIEPALAHKIAVEFADRAFPGHEVVVATHTDADHIHSHFVLNAVNADTGLKYHSNKFTLQDLRQLSDEICQKYGVTTLNKPEIHKQSDGITNGEYRVAMRGESYTEFGIDSLNYIHHISLICSLDRILFIIGMKSSKQSYSFLRFFTCSLNDLASGLISVLLMIFPSSIWKSITSLYLKKYLLSSKQQL